MEDGVHSVVFHVVPNPDDPTRKSDLALGFSQGNILLIQEAFCAVLCNDRSVVEFIRPPILDGIYSREREKIASTNPINIGNMTTTHTWGDDCVHARSREYSRRPFRDGCSIPGAEAKGTRGTISMVF